MKSRLLDIPVDDDRPLVLGREGARVMTTSGSLIESGGGSHATCVVNDGGELKQRICEAIDETVVGTGRGYAHAAQIELGSRVASLTDDVESKVYFTSGGTEAFETALRLVFHVQKNRGQEQRSLVLGHRYSYHGMSLAARNASDHPDHFPSPSGIDLRWPKLSGAESGAIEADKQMLERLGENVAAVIIEPVSGTTGGATVRSVAYLEWLAESCRRLGIILIVDEVVTAFGRTGVGFSSAGMKPDVILGGKCLAAGYAPIGCVVLSGALCDELRRFEVPLPLRLTFSANVVACAIASAVQCHCEKHQLFERVMNNGPNIRGLLWSIASQCPAPIDISGVGHLWGLHARLPAGSGADVLARIKSQARNRGIEYMGGLKVGEAGERIHMTLTPPFDLSRVALEEVLTVSMRFFCEEVYQSKWDSAKDSN